MNKDQKLTFKQQMFCEEYIKDWNATRAAKVAGYSEKTASVIGQQNLTKLYIQSYIEEIQKDLQKQANISKLQTLNEWKSIAASNITDILDIDKTGMLTIKGGAKLSDLPKEITKNIQEIQQTKDGIKIKLYPRTQGLENIQKMLGFNEPEKIEEARGSRITVTDGGIITMIDN